MRGLSLILAGLLLFSCAKGLAEQTKRSATISGIEGIVEVKIEKKSWLKAEIGMILNQGDMVRTRRDSSCLLDLDGGAQTAIVEMKENSQLKLAQVLEDKDKGTQKTLLDLSLGEILIKAKKLHSEKASFEVKTPTSIVGVRGTTFSVAVEAME